MFVTRRSTGIKFSARKMFSHQRTSIGFHEVFASHGARSVANRRKIWALASCCGVGILEPYLHVHGKEKRACRLRWNGEYVNARGDYYFQ
jgi:hypothetical protein